MKRILEAVLQYRIVALTLFVGVVGGILWAFSQTRAIQVLFSTYSLAIGAVLAWQMLKELRRGRFGVDILAVIAVVTTVLVGEYRRVISHGGEHAGAQA